MDGMPSKSAIYVQTSEFSAFTTIFRSVGPVISVLLSTNPGAGAAPFHVTLLRIAFVSSKKSGNTPLSRSAWRTSRRCSNSLRLALNERWRRARNTVASLLRILRVWSLSGPKMDTPSLMASRLDILMELMWILFMFRRKSEGAKNHKNNLNFQYVTQLASRKLSSMEERKRLFTAGKSSAFLFCAIVDPIPSPEFATEASRDNPAHGLMCTMLRRRPLAGTLP